MTSKMRSEAIQVTLERCDQDRRVSEMQTVDSPVWKTVVDGRALVSDLADGSKTAGAEARLALLKDLFRLINAETDCSSVWAAIDAIN